MADGAKKTSRDGKTVFVCASCGAENKRALYFGGPVKEWIAEDGEFWHASVGVFVRNSDGKYLFLDRTEFPFGIAPPAGHVDENEESLVAARRELEEEVGISTDDLKLAATADVLGDSCSGGSDAHQWSIYVCDLPEGQKLTINSEGKRPVWLSLEEAAQREKPFVIEYILKNHSKQINDAK
jgi:8-oxo-dGTP pyrophosphatase MutT (NUDIX family)